MTAVSTLLAIGMLPLNLFIYSRSWTDTALIIPYLNIFKSFALMIVPATVGILVKWKLPKLAEILVKVNIATYNIFVCLKIHYVNISRIYCQVIAEMNTCTIFDCGSFS